MTRRKYINPADSIDGIVATIMALGRAQLDPEPDDGPILYVDDS
jgi:hypothetical protein